VTALLVAHDGAAWLPRCLAAVLAQGADEVVAVDTGSTDDSPQLLRAALGADRVVIADRRTGFGDAVRLAIAQADTLSAERPADDQRWFWLLHDDCAPEPGALDALLDTAARSRHAGIVGPKLVAWDDPTRLLEVGLTVSRGGRRFAGVDGPERDQGQHDEVTDVLALGTAGLLVRADVWADLGGLDPALPLLRDDVDLGWRAQLAGYRVVLASRALVADAQASTRGLRRVDAVRGPVRRVDRVHALRVALARCSPWTLLPLLCWLLVAGIGRALGLLAAKAPRRSLDELVATATVLLTPWTWIALRWRGRSTVRVRRRDINQLLVPRLAVVRRAVDAVGVLAVRERDDASDRALSALSAVSAAPAEPGPTSDEADAVAVVPRLWLRRLVTHPLTLLILALAAVTVVSWRGLLGRVLAHPALVGGELGRVTGRPGDLWQSALGGWGGSGLGVDVVSSPAAFVRAAAVTVLHPMAGDQAGALAVLLLLLLAPVVAAVAAYLALTGFVRSRWVRAWAGLAWATVPLAATAVAGGRLGVLAALVLLPLVVAAFARALAPGHRGSTTAAFAGALGVALLAAAAPVMLLPALAVAVVGVVAGRGSARLRSLALLLVPLGLLGPWLGALLSDPRHLLAGPGLLATATTPVRAGGWLQLSSLQPWTQLVRPPDGVPAWVVVVAAAPVVLAGLVGLLRAGPRGRTLLLLWLIGVAGLAAAVLAPFVVLERGAAGPLGPWSGTALLLTALAAVTSAAVGADGLRGRLSEHRFGWRQVLVAPVVALAVLGPVAGAGLAARRGAAGPLASGASAPLPAVVAAAAPGPAGVRTLELRPAGQALAYRLDGVEPGPWSRDLAVASPAASGPADDPVRAVVRDLVDGPAGFAAGEAAVEQLGRLAVGFVLVRGEASGAVLARLDSTAGLARIGAPTGSALWRVGTGGLGTGSAAALGAGQERPARVRVEAPDGAVLQTLPVAGAHAATSVTLVPTGPSAKGATPAERLLVLAEPASPRWRATLDGRSLTSVRPQTGPWRQAFRLPDRPGHLVVSYDRSGQRWWRVGQGVLAGLVLLLALPVRRPREESA
jgi:GT2 family glycosyltransferase